MNPPPQPPFGQGYAADPQPFYTAGSVQSILDDEHLRLLRIGYFISAGQTAIIIPFGLFYAALGLVVGHLPSSATPPPAPFVPLFFGIVGAAITGFAAVTAVLKLVTGIRLKERRGRLLCLITAGISLLEIPYGTALGLMTFIVLGRPNVKQQFERSG